MQALECNVYANFVKNLGSFFFLTRVKNITYEMLHLKFSLILFHALAVLHVFSLNMIPTDLAYLLHAELK